MIKVLRLPHAFALPAYKSEGAAGLDVYAAEQAYLPIRARTIIKTGLCFEIPPGWEIQVRSRSGLAANDSVFVLNSPGTVDSDFRGELMIILMNLGSKVLRIAAGDRIAQLVPAPVSRLPIVEVSALSETARGEGRFGSTGR